MPSLSPPTRPLSRRTTRLLIAVSVLAALVALPRAHASTPPAAAQAAGTPATPALAAAPKTSKPSGASPTCQAIMQRLSGSLAATPSSADKLGAVMIDVDKAGVTMACSHSDSIAIPVPGGKPR